MDPRTTLDHKFMMAAFAVTWILQLGYLLRLGVIWLHQRKSLPGNTPR